MQVRKLQAKALEVGKIYIAYSARNKLLSSNGDSGMLVKVDSVAGVNIKVKMLGTDTVTAITKLDTRNDAWIYDPAGNEVNVVARVKDKKAWPGFSKRMEQEGWDGKQFIFDEEELYEISEEDSAEYAGVLTLRHEGQTIDPEEDAPYVNVFLTTNIFPANPPEWRIPRAQRMGVGAVEVMLPPKRVSAEDEETISLLAEALAEFKAVLNQGATATFAKVAAAGNILKSYTRAACHAELGYGEYKDTRYVLSDCRDPVAGVTEDMLNAFINYLTGYSPFAEAFIVKDAAWIRENGYVLTAEVSAQVLAGACIATRQAWEYPHIIKAWYGLVEQGIEYNAAFIFGARSTDSWKFTMAGMGHTVFDHDRMGEKAIINFIDGKPVNQNKVPYYKDNAYRGVNAMWGDDGKKPAVLSRLEKIGGVAKAWGKVGIAFEDAMEQAADIIDDWAKETGV